MKKIHMVILMANDEIKSKHISLWLCGAALSGVIGNTAYALLNKALGTDLGQWLMGNVWPASDKWPEIRHWLIVVIIAGLLIAGVRFWRIHKRMKMALQSSTVATSSPIDIHNGALLRWDEHLGHTYSSKNNTIYTVAIQISGRNESQQEVQLEDACIISGITGVKIPMKVGTSDGWIASNETNPIPPNGSVTLRAEFNEPDGFSAQDFVRDWGKIYLNVRYDGDVYRKTIDENMVLAMYANFRPSPLGPRVT